MATSPIYGWLEPDNTDLVKNGALAIRTLGNAIDTTMATMTPKSLVDAKGDLIAASANDTPARLAVGANGETLVADSSTSTGLRYTGLFGANKNKILNGDFNINQRSFTSTTSSATYTFDRWLTSLSDGTVTYSTQAFTAGAAPVAGYEGTNFLRIVTSGQTLTSARSVIQQRIEDVRTFANQTVTISFWAKAATGTPFVGSNFTQAYGSGGSLTDAGTGQKVAITTSWARYSLTFTIPSISGKTIGAGSYLQARLFTSSGSDESTQNASMGIQNATIDFWGVQVEAGSVATPFQTATGTLQGELAACQRYYYRAGGTGGGFGYLGTGIATSTTGGEFQTVFPVTMRVTPTSMDFSTIRASDGVTGSGAGTLTINGSGTFPAIGATTLTGVTGLTQYRPYLLQQAGSSLAYVGFSAEL
jgi:hypothetical protein